MSCDVISIIQLAQLRAKARLDKKLEDDAFTGNTLVIETSGSTKDSFKGLSKEKQREMLLENERLKELKK